METVKIDTVAGYETDAGLEAGLIADVERGCERFWKRRGLEGAPDDYAWTRRRRAKRIRPRITVAVRCHDQQRALCWMLSSLVQQTEPHLVAVNVVHLSRNGWPWTEDICDRFAPRLTIQRTAWADCSTFQQPDILRSFQVDRCSTEWLMFAPCDAVYHPGWTEKLLDLLDRHHKAARYGLAAGCVTVGKRTAARLLKHDSSATGREIPEAFDFVKPVPKKLASDFNWCRIVNVKHKAGTDTASLPEWYGNSAVRIIA